MTWGGMNNEVIMEGQESGGYSDRNRNICFNV